MQARHLLLVLPLGVVLTTGCSRSSPAVPSPAASTTVVNAIQGNWRSLDVSSTGSCTNITFAVTQIGVLSASVMFGASCGTSSFVTPAIGSVSGDTLVWAPDVSFSTSLCAGDSRGSRSQVRGTALPLGESTATLTYSGTVCGAPIGGSVTLSRQGR